MKRLLVLFLAIGLIGCATVTDWVYGPDMTLDQLRDAIYEDGYAIGSILSANKTDEQKRDMIDQADLIRGSSDPMSVASQQFYDAIRDNESEQALVWFAIRRVLQNVGIGIINDAYEDAGIDIDLWGIFVGAYIDGINQTHG